MEIFKKIDALKKEIDALRPISKDLEAKIMQKFRLDWNYNSNAIEGNRLTFGETKTFLLHGITADGKPLKDHLDIEGHNSALLLLEEIIHEDRPITEAFIRGLHEMILQKDYYNKAINRQIKNLNKTPISRQALEKVYYESLQPFFKGLTKMAQEFDNLFAVIELPDTSLSLLDSLDSTLYFAWWEFVVEKSLNFELEIQIHFNRYDYVVEWGIKDSNYHKKIQKDYDSNFSNVAQLDCINELGRFIIDQVKDKYQ